MYYWFLYRLYSLLWIIALPFALLRLLWRSLKEPAYRSYICERLAWYSQSESGSANAGLLPVIWVHAVSVGETQAALPLIEGLLQAYPKHRVLLTHMTPGGRAFGRQFLLNNKNTALAARIEQAYLPYDLPVFLRRFLRRHQPSLGVLIETEVWPNLIALCQKQGLPIVLANARMSPKSFERAQCLGGIARYVFSGLTQILAQSEINAQRFRALGVKNITTVGNLKFDVRPDAELLAQGQSWRKFIGNRPIWLAASTREGEEAMLLDAYQCLSDQNTLLVLVPRHAQRFSAVAELLKQRGLLYQKRSDWDQLTSVPSSINVLLGDSMGEMSAYYALCDVAFIGGSLLPYGGHNFIEACAIGKPVLFGPYMFNFEQAAQDALNAGAANQLNTVEALVDAIDALNMHREIAHQMATNALSFGEKHTGAVQQSIKVLTKYLKN